jgi:glycerol-3-phosphate acyltransferase PlsY
MILDAARIVLGYLLGSVSGSLLLGWLRGIDIRTQGSGNAGGHECLSHPRTVVCARRALGCAICGAGCGR